MNNLLFPNEYTENLASYFSAQTPYDSSEKIKKSYTHALDYKPRSVSLIPVSLDSIQAGNLPRYGYLNWPLSSCSQLNSIRKIENRIIGSSQVVLRKCISEFYDAKQQQLKEESCQGFIYPPHTFSSHLNVTTHILSSNTVVACMQGRRPNMEDTHVVKCFRFYAESKINYAQLYGLFDGHGGQEAAEYTKNNLVKHVRQTLQIFCNQKISDVGIFNALKLAFVNLNREYKGEGGTTATVAIIIGNNLWVANLGDSRTLLINGDEIIQMTEDAKPGVEKYNRGIRKRHGYVLEYFGKRVGGVLAVARGIGDKEIMGISARPKIVKYPLDELKFGSYLMLACDGLWDVCSSKQAGEALIKDKNHYPLSEIAKNLVQAAYQANSWDNISVLLSKIK